MNLPPGYERAALGLMTRSAEVNANGVGSASRVSEKDFSMALTLVSEQAIVIDRATRIAEQPMMPDPFHDGWKWYYDLCRAKEKFEGWK